MLISVRYLVDRARHPRQRADELLSLRARLAEQPTAAQASAELVALAQKLLRLRRELSAAFAGVRSCSSCAINHPEPFGHWDGGHCCGGSSDKLFTDDELAALKLSGTTAGKLSPPQSDFAGCVFRGPTGCSLSVDDRPNICVRYLCRTQERELLERGDKAKIVALAKELGETFEQFAALRADAEMFPEQLAAMM
ncbi:MAG: hypothetical protein R3B13_25130 [Polyangiaceae bacterium]